MTVQEKARFFMAARQQGDKRCDLLLMMLSLATRVPLDVCLQQIEELAK